MIPKKQIIKCTIPLIFNDTGIKNTIEAYVRKNVYTTIIDMKWE